MNKYTFTYYGWIPGYNDFDQEWIDVEADSYEEAIVKLRKLVRFAKSEPALYAVNGRVIQNLEYH